MDTGSFSSDLATNMFIAGTLQHFWSFVASQQIIVIMPLFAISLPANAMTIYEVLFQIAEFDMIPTDEFFSPMHEELEEFGPSEDPLKDKMEPLGFETVWFLSNLGSIIVLFGVYLLLLVILVLMTLLQYCFPHKSRKSLRFKTNRLRVFALYNAPITFLRDSFIVIAICCVYNTAYLTFETRIAALNSWLALITMLFLILYPACLHYYLYRHREDLQDKEQKDKWSNVESAYLYLDVREGKAFAYPLFFYYTRLFITVSVVVFPDTFIVHYAVITGTTIATIIFVGHETPFVSLMRNKVEVME